MNDDFYTEEPDASNVKSNLNVEYDPKADEIKQQVNEQKKYSQILQRFRVISPAEVNKMMEQGNRPAFHQPDVNGAQV